MSCRRSGAVAVLIHHPVCALFGVRIAGLCWTIRIGACSHSTDRLWERYGASARLDAVACPGFGCGGGGAAGRFDLPVCGPVHQALAKLRSGDLSAGPFPRLHRPAALAALRRLWSREPADTPVDVQMRRLNLLC